MTLLDEMRGCLRFDLTDPTESETESIMRRAIMEIERMREAMTGWDAYGWKNGEFVDDLDKYFKKILK